MINSRRDSMMEYILEKGEVHFNELERLFPDVSGMTLRRDLAYLEESGVIIRTRGGARAINRLGGMKENIYSLRATENIEAKMKVARKALELVETRRSIFIDSGTTTMCLAKVLPDMNLSILTSGPTIGLEIIKNSGASVTLTGGQLSRNNLSTSGPCSQEFIKGINIDIAFMAASGFSLKSGFTSGDYNECELKKQVIKKADKVIMLMDSSKLDKNMPFTFAQLKDINVLISDSALPGDIVKQSEKLGVKIY